jgi:Right handed beta helix region
VKANPLKLLLLLTGFFATLVFAGADATQAAAQPTLYVGTTNCSDAYSRVQASSPQTPWCSIGRATSSVVAGDLVLVAPGRYLEAPALRRSGTPDAPIVFSAAGAVIDAGQQTTGLTLNGVSDVQFQELAVTNASSIGVWIGTSQRISFAGADIYANGSGIKLKDSTSISVRQSSIHDNKSAGIMELGTTTKNTLYESDTISGNGFSPDIYNGDGIQLASQGAVIRNCTITNNGSSNLYEHGIYASSRASGYLIDSNRFDGNSATSVKAAGEGAILNNSFGASRLGSYVGDSSGSGAYYAGNSFLGPFSAQAILIGSTGWASFGEGNSGLPAPAPA